MLLHNFCIFLSLPEWFPSGIFAAPLLDLHPQNCVQSPKLCCLQREQIIDLKWGLWWTITWQRFSEQITEISLAPSAQPQNYKFWIRTQQNSQTTLNVRGRQSSFRWFLWFSPDFVIYPVLDLLCSIPVSGMGRKESFFYFCVLFLLSHSIQNPLDVQDGSGGTTNSPGWKQQQRSRDGIAGIKSEPVLQDIGKVPSSISLER